MQLTIGLVRGLVSPSGTPTPIPPPGVLNKVFHMGVLVEVY